MQEFIEFLDERLKYTTEYYLIKPPEEIKTIKTKYLELREKNLKKTREAIESFIKFHIDSKTQAFGDVIQWEGNDESIKLFASQMIAFLYDQGLI
ncbi:MAG: hypothetical protein ACFFDT_22670 [Candidatus Hodarchaeota archaeon]